MPKPRSARDFRNTYIRLLPGEQIQFAQWFRSPLWGSCHCLGRTRDHYEIGLAWCGRGLTDVQNWDNEEYGGLWYEQRSRAHCAECKRREKEWEASGRY